MAFISRPYGIFLYNYCIKSLPVQERGQEFSNKFVMPYNCPFIIAIKLLNAIQTLIKVVFGRLSNIGPEWICIKRGLIESYFTIDLLAVVLHLSFIKPVIFFK